MREPNATSQRSCERYSLSTEAFAAQHLVEPQSVRKQYSLHGSYHGVRPIRLPNRRLLWPADTIARLAAEAFGSGDKA